MEENKVENIVPSEQINLFEEADSSYKVKLEQFEGPIELLYHLCKEAKLDIMTVKLSQITEQYLEYMEQLPEIDMDKASSFISVATTLLESKSKKLLPRPEELVQNEEDPEQRILQALQEYTIIKEASEKLHNIENINKFYKEPDKSANKYKIVLKDMVLDGLLDAFSNILAKNLEKKEETKEKEIQKDRFTVAEKIAAIKDAILIKDKISFSELVSEDNTKSEIINIFLALLELLKLQVIKARQVNNFNEIEICKYVEDDENV